MPEPKERPSSQVEEGQKDPSADVVEGAAAEKLTDGIPPKSYGKMPMVGLGGSAGSITALQTFFAAMPADSGMVFVVILHLSPDYESRLAEMFQRSTTMPVVAARDGVHAEPNCVYVIPPGKHLTCYDGMLRLGEAEHARGRRVAVDTFFRTLADSHGQQSVAIVLSGADGDGALGIKRVKERGGLTITQDPDECEYPDMPLAAIGTGMVDWVLKVREMPARLLAYRDSGERLKIPAEEGPDPVQTEAAAPNDNEVALRDILAFLRTRTGSDFSYYKRATILRRIARRMQVNGLEDLPSYLLHLRTHTGESVALLQDLLISVTNFFRDREAFEALAKFIPEIFRGKGPSDTVRVWSSACATGEEAYSLAMLLCEHARTLESPPQIQVFATDLDDAAIRIARDGFYAESISSDVSDERLRRFFIHEKGGYRIRREIREIVLFAPHDLLNDSPFSRLDLVSCRNLLIYLNREAQERALNILHFALRPGGRLFLGLSEAVDDENALFTAEDKKHRLFVQRPGRRNGLAGTFGSGTLARALELQERSRERSVLPKAFEPENGGPKQEENAANDPSTPGLLPSELHYRFVERLSSPSILVNASYEIVHLSEDAGRFLQYPGGEPTRNLLRAVHPMLRIDLRAALYSVAQTRTSTMALGVPFDTPDGTRVVDIRVSCADDLSSDFLLVVFAQRTPSEDVILRPAARADQADVARHLEQALEATKAQLRETIEQSEASTEELKASNEELQAMNEELRSATEELETSREELHSVNEELTSVNQEVTGKVDELAVANSDLQNLMSATAIATVFLDRDLRIMRYTPTAVELFNLIPTDVGRRLSDLANRLDYPDMVGDATQALARLSSSQREVTSNGRHFLARTFPYRSTEDRIAGVVLTFLDITTLKQGEEELRRSEERFRAMADVIPQLAWIARADGFVFWFNRNWYNYTGTTPEAMIGWGWQSVHDPRNLSEVMERWNESIRTGNSFEMTFPIRGVDGSFRTFLTRIEPLKNPDGKVTQWFGTSTDVEDLIRSEDALRTAKIGAEAANLSKDRFLAVLSHELRTPLTPVLMTVAALGQDKNLGDEVRRDLAMIKRNIELETRLIDDLLDLSRIKSGKFELVPEAIDLNEAVRQVSSICRQQMEEKNVRLEMELSDSVGVISADAARLQQVLWNVLKNAVKFTHENGTVRIRTARVSPETCEVRIEDTGIGIPADVLPRIFDAFEQGDANITRKFGGLGLGLTISRALIELQGGSIRAESAGEGKGSTFIIELPGTKVPVAISDRPEIPARDKGSQPLHVLLVEDHPDTSRVLLRFLRAAGFAVTGARDVASARAAAQQHSFDLVVSDIGLPDGNGYDLIRELRSVRPIPGIAMSGFGMEDDIRRSREAGFAAHLTKPVTIPRLLAAIRKIPELHF